MSHGKIHEYNELRKFLDEHFKNGGSSMTNPIRATLEELDEIWTSMSPEEQAEVD